MGKLADLTKKYFDETPSELLKKDWEELKKYNKVGPNIEDVIKPALLHSFCITANINWLQFIILNLVVNHPDNPDIKLMVSELLLLGGNYDIFNAVPRVCFGDKVVDLEHRIKKELEELIPTDHPWHNIVKLVLMGNYQPALQELIDTKL